MADQVPSAEDVVVKIQALTEELIEFKKVYNKNTKELEARVLAIEEDAAYNSIEEAGLARKREKMMEDRFKNIEQNYSKRRMVSNTTFGGKDFEY